MKLKELGEYYIGLTYKPDSVSDDGTIVLRSGNIQDGQIDLSDIVRVNTKIREKLYVNPGDILMCSRNGSAKLVGKAAMIPSLAEPMTFGAFMTVFRTPYNDYLKYFLQSNSFRRQLSSSKTTTINQITINMLDNIEIELPGEADRELRCQKLELLQHLIYLREKQIARFDELIKARFVEMFGDPQINPFKWDVVNISEVVGGKVSNGFFAKRDDYCEDGNIRVLGVANIVNRMYSNLDDLPRTNADDKDIKKYEVKYGDMLFCRSSLVAEGIGKASIIPEDVQENILFECHVIRLPLDLNKCVPEFMQTLSTMDYFRNQVISQSKTATMTTIGQDGILKTDIILPPIEKQKEFYSFVKQIDKSKSVVQKSLDEAQLLFDSLMQQFFG